MKLPIPANSTEPLRVGDIVRIAPPFRDQCDGGFDRVVIEAPDDCTRVLVVTLIPG